MELGRRFIQKDAGIHFQFAYLVRYSAEEDALKEGMKQIEEVRQFFRDAKAYFGESKHEHTNIKFEAVKVCLTEHRSFMRIANS